jgi:methylthioribose-1-phosphate isomerase
MIPPGGLDGIYDSSINVTPAELITEIVTEMGVAVKGSDGRFAALFKS